MLASAVPLSYIPSPVWRMVRETKEEGGNCWRSNHPKVINTVNFVFFKSFHGTFKCSSIIRSITCISWEGREKREVWHCSEYFNISLCQSFCIKFYFVRIKSRNRINRVKAKRILVKISWAVMLYWLTFQCYLNDDFEQWW